MRTPAKSTISNDLKAMDKIVNDIRYIINLHPHIDTVDKMCQCLYFGTLTDTWDTISKSALSRTDIKLLVSSVMG